MLHYYTIGCFTLKPDAALLFTAPVKGETVIVGGGGQKFTARKHCHTSVPDLGPRYIRQVDSKSLKSSD